MDLIFLKTPHLLSQTSGFFIFSNKDESIEIVYF